MGNQRSGEKTQFCRYKGSTAMRVSVALCGPCLKIQATWKNVLEQLSVPFESKAVMLNSFEER